MVRGNQLFPLGVAVNLSRSKLKSSQSTIAFQMGSLVTDSGKSQHVVSDRLDTGKYFSLEGLNAVGRITSKKFLYSENDKTFRKYVGISAKCAGMIKGNVEYS